MILCVAAESLFVSAYWLLSVSVADCHARPWNDSEKRNDVCNRHFWVSTVSSKWCPTFLARRFFTPLFLGLYLRVSAKSIHPISRKTSWDEGWDDIKYDFSQTKHAHRRIYQWSLEVAKDNGRRFRSVSVRNVLTEISNREHCYDTAKIDQSEDDVGSHKTHGIAANTVVTMLRRKRNEQKCLWKNVFMCSCSPAFDVMM